MLTSLLQTECLHSPSPTNIYVEMSKVMVFGGGAVGWLGHESEALMGGISALMKEAPRAPLPFLPCEDTAPRQPPTYKNVTYQVYQ